MFYVLQNEIKEQIYQALQVRFVKLYFTIAFKENSRLPKDKVSALRGGVGDILLDLNCIRNRQCETCDFESECIVQRIMYSKYEKRPEFVTTDGGIGYILECEDYRENFKAGDTMDFCLILFGKTIVYFNQYVQAFQVMGRQCGIGKSHAKFQITGIRNTEGQSIFQGDIVNMDKYVVHTLYDYILFREMSDEHIMYKNTIIFDTPLALKYQNDLLKEFQIEAILNSILRRIYMLNCFEGKETDIMSYNDDIGPAPEILRQEHYPVHVCRYSTRKDCKMILKGIKGYAVLAELSQEAALLLMVGELIHIGKNTSFGFGKYHLV